MRNYDLDFLKKFSLVLGFLVVVAIGLIVFASYLHGTLPKDPNPAVVARIDARIAPVGAVYAGETGAAAQAAAAAAALEAAAANVAYGGTLDGATIYQNLCGGCHTAGVAGAPKLVAAEWTARIAQGVDVLHQHAIEGYQGQSGFMPPKGGNPALTDEQVVATVDWMVGNLE